MAPVSVHQVYFRVNFPADLRALPPRCSRNETITVDFAAGAKARSTNKSCENVKLDAEQ